MKPPLICGGFKLLVLLVPLCGDA